MAKEVNFSDRSPKRNDPHSWLRHLADVVLRGQVLWQMWVYECQVCGHLESMQPKFVHDLPECNAKNLNVPS